ncbi:MAG: DUF6605 domain-containing protein [Caldilineaceae bacterium]
MTFKTRLKMRRIWQLILFASLCITVVAIQYSTSNLTPYRAFAQTNPIVLENQNPGTTKWQIDYNIGTVSNDSAQQIKGYGSAPSIDQGQSINFYVTVNPTQTFTIDVFRMGWYNGAGGRLMQSIGPLSGTPQPACPQDPTTGLTECNWAIAYTLTVPANWTSGIYLAKLTNTQGFQNYIIFVVRDDDRTADFLYQQSVTTYQAYNNYPDNGTTGKSLYTHNSYGANTIYGTPRAVKVSFDRPYGGTGGYDGGGQFVEEQWWERYFVNWVERMGYDVSYSTDVDTHVNGARLLNFKGFLSVGHDEYWSKQMYDAAETARNAGVNLAFFGADAVYYQIRFEPSSTGVSNRVMVNYRNAALDPNPDPTLKTGFWRDVNRAEQQLIGVQYVTDGSFSNMLPYYIANASHWVWANTGFVNGSAVPGLLGYEVDKLFSEFPAPPAVSYTVLANSTYTSTSYIPNVVAPSQSSIYQTGSGSWVFAAGTMAWAWGLDRPGYVNAGIQQATKNILDRFAQPLVPPSPTPTATATPPPNCTGLQREAEAGTLVGPFVIGNDPAASGGQYIHVPNGVGDQPGVPSQAKKATYCFTVTTPGTYRIKAGVYGANTLDDSFYVQVDNAPAAGYTWDIFLNTTYASDYINNRGVADPLELQLTAGQHTVSIFLREDGTRLDNLQLELVDRGPGPDPVCAGLTQEAETGGLSGPFMIGNDATASGGQYVHAPNGTGDQWNGPNVSRKAAYCFNVATPGIYRIKTKTYAASTADDSFYVQVDGAPAVGYMWDIPITTTYASSYVTDRGVPGPVQIQLPTGAHTVTFYVREDGARLDTVQLELVSAGPGPDPTCAGLVQEAETGSLSGAFAIGNDALASGGQYVSTSESAGDQWNGPNPQHKVAFCFNVAAAGNYRIRSKVYGADDLSDSFYVQVDGAPAAGMNWDIFPNTTYQYDFVNNRNVADPVQVVLTSGPHTVTVFLREDAARLDTIELVPVIQGTGAKTVQTTIEDGHLSKPGELLAKGVSGYIYPQTGSQSGEVDFAGIYLTLRDEETQGQRFSQRVQADRIGHYRFDGMKPGRYLLTLELPDAYQTSTKSLEVTATAEQEVNIAFDVVMEGNGTEATQKIFLPLMNR